MKKTLNLETLTFDNKFVRDLPADPETRNLRRQISNACYSRVTPMLIAQPKMRSFSKEVAESLDLSEESTNSTRFTEVFSGQNLLEGMAPYATCYGGHQFGSWAGQLGDGRAINLGEIINLKGQRLALQLKGAGPTPYSRTADGLAVLRSSIREYLCSEAMFHLGVPTTRALSLATTGQAVMRDMFYDGHPKAELGAIVCRVAPSFTRFGHFQMLASRGEHALLQRLVDYTIETDFPHLGKPSKDTILAWFDEVCQLTAKMIVHWMRVGFVHGVMNTDNMSILGLTIDYGPYGWLENYDPNWTPNTTDAQGRRYRFSHQAQIAQWNLLQLAYAIHPLIGETDVFEKSFNHFSVQYETHWQNMMAQKLGLNCYQATTDESLISDLLSLLQLSETDMTLFYRKLADIQTKKKRQSLPDDETLISPLKQAYYAPEKRNAVQKQETAAWLKRYINRLSEEGSDDASRKKKMNAVNPKYIFRNYLAQLAIDKSEGGDDSMIEELLELFRHPYDEQPEKEHLAEKRPEWARKRAGCSMLSCSS